jgi:hypothetical protein
MGSRRTRLLNAISLALMWCFGVYGGAAVPTEWRGTAAWTALVLGIARSCIAFAMRSAGRSEVATTPHLPRN